MRRLFRQLGQLLHPSWWHLRYGNPLTELTLSARSTNRRGDLLLGIAKLEWRRWTWRRVLAVIGIRGELRNSDFMQDVFRSLGFEYAAANLGTTVLAVHESMVNYGGNRAPEFLLCLHEESAVGLALGHSRMSGSPMLVLLHGSIGVQHAAMAIHHAYASHAPVCLIAGNGSRRFRAHNARDLAALVRDDLKWDDEPRSLDEFAGSMLRAYKIASTPPAGPALLVLDQLMQEAPFTQAHLEIPKFARTFAPQADRETVQKAAEWLTQAVRPLIVAQRAARTTAGFDLLVQLSETLQAPVWSLGWLNFPNRHPLAGSGGEGYRPDLVLLLETCDLPCAVTADWPQDVKRIRISASLLADCTGPSNGESIAIDADAESALPVLIDECRKRISPSRKQDLKERGNAVADRHRQEREIWRQQAEATAADSFTMAGLCASLWPVIENEDWSLVSCDPSTAVWPLRLWNFDRPHRFIGALDQDSRGINAPAALGAALANRKHSRLSVNLQSVDDLMRAPGVLWTAAHHKIPLLTIALAEGTGSAAPGAEIRCAELARSLGVQAEGPITGPRDLMPALQWAIERVKLGEPALIEIQIQERADHNG